MTMTYSIEIVRVGDQGTAHHDYHRGVEDLRQFLGRCHADRRFSWQEWKKTHDQT